MISKIIAPSILSADFTRLGEELNEIEKAGLDWVHLDIMDGHYVPNLTFGPPVVAKLRQVSNLFFDVHLMVENPEFFIDAFIDAGADAITIHAETCKHLHRQVQTIKGAGKLAGIALNPSTPLSHLEWLMEDIDFVLIMSVNPGFGGQTFIKFSIEKIIELQKMIKNKMSEVAIAVDGGVNSNNLKLISDAGANIFIIGSDFFSNSVNYSEKYEGYKKILG